MSSTAGEQRPGHAARGAEHQRDPPSRIDARTTQDPGYAVSFRIRKRIEEGLRWVKEVAGLAFVLGLVAHNRPRLPKLLGHPYEPRGSLPGPKRSPGAHIEGPLIDDRRSRSIMRTQSPAQVGSGLPACSWTIYSAYRSGQPASCWPVRFS